MGDGGGAAQAKGTSLFLQIVEHPDGTISRPTVPVAPPTGDQHPDSSSSSSFVLSKDVPLNTTHKTFLRIYRPNLPSSQKLPIVIFFHGGGFVVFSTASVFYHEFCEQMAAALPALVISLDYRLAPESRLPAAYEDAVEAILWVRAQAKTVGEPWLTSHVDFSRCFLMGSSSGANMAYHAGLRAVALELQPVRLVGLILNQPYFGGVERTPSELASEEDAVVPLRANDLMWRLALPKGADRDHEFCNPVVSPPRPIRLPRCMVKGCHGDPLIDRQRAFAKMLEEEGASVVASFDEGGLHAIELFDPSRKALFAEIRDFISSSSTDADDANKV